MKKILLTAFIFSFILSLSFYTVLSNPCGSGCGRGEEISFLNPLGKMIDRDPNVTCANVYLRTPHRYFYFSADITIVLGLIVGIIYLKNKIILSANSTT